MKHIFIIETADDVHLSPKDIDTLTLKAQEMVEECVSGHEAFWTCRLEIAMREFVDNQPYWFRVARELLTAFVIAAAVVAVALFALIFTPDTQY